MKTFATILVAIVIVLFATSPYITVGQMKLAAENHDGEALSEHIEFTSVRQSLKDQMNAMITKEMAKDGMKGNPFAALGAAFSGFMVDKMVEAYVTPAAITRLMAGEAPKPTEGGESGGSSARKPLSDVSMSYESLNKFVIKVKGDDGEEGTFVLRRRGIGWKLTEIIMPLEKTSTLSSFTAPTPSPAAETKAPLELPPAPKRHFNDYAGLTNDAKQQSAEVAGSAIAQTLEAQCREIATREYPTDSEMQRFTYKQQLTAARYMSNAASDGEAKGIAVHEYAEDFEMQKFTYNQQLAAKVYMAAVEDAEIKKIALGEYPSDFEMQKFTYNQQLAAKVYMAAVEDAEIKQIALGEYPSDFEMQKFTYNQQLAAKAYMQSVAAAAKQQAVREYPNDYEMQKFTYGQLTQDR